MGASKSRPGRPNFKELSQRTHFDIAEIKALYSHFKSISGSEVDDELIDQSEMKRALGLHGELFANRLFGLFDLNSDGVVNFNEFVEGLSVFMPQASVEEKLNLSFRIYDFDGDGFIDRAELLECLRASLKESSLGITESQVVGLVDKTIQEADTNGDGLIDYSEYKALVLRHPIMIKHMTLPDPVDCARGKRG